MQDSLMSTCLTSTLTVYCILSDFCVPVNLLPGRKNDDGEDCKSYRVLVSGSSK